MEAKRHELHFYGLMKIFWQTLVSYFDYTSILEYDKSSDFTMSRIERVIDFNRASKCIFFKVITD